MKLVQIDRYLKKQNLGVCRLGAQDLGHGVMDPNPLGSLSTQPRNQLEYHILGVPASLG